MLQSLWTSENIAQKAVILVGNKADLARCRHVTSEGKCCVNDDENGDQNVLAPSFDFSPFCYFSFFFFFLLNASTPYTTHLIFTVVIFVTVMLLFLVLFLYGWCACNFRARDLYILEGVLLWNNFALKCWAIAKKKRYWREKKCNAHICINTKTNEKATVHIMQVKKKLCKILNST